MSCIMASSLSASCSNSAVTTRRKTDIWLVGQTSSISQAKLPTKQEVLRLFFHYKSDSKQNIKKCCHFTADDVLSVWEKAGIPTQLKKHVVGKVENLFRDWQKLKKNKENKAKRSEGIKQKEEEWQMKLKNLFDIAHADALNMIRIQEDKDFLIAQREKDRRGQIGNLDRS
ncbi:unnamed protein product [Brassicogethes aeneus]|uniref:Uncharacterized protein n=1 Tax=Brassicogethes aeneus TaxID=1431903 RepID=A0A9P0BD28_BRAAE|nr:unnamed protein product [Brassicogethes aeneus]